MQRSFRSTLLNSNLAYLNLPLLCQSKEQEVLARGQFYNPSQFLSDSHHFVFFMHDYLFFYHLLEEFDDGLTINYKGTSFPLPHIVTKPALVARPCYSGIYSAKRPCVTLLYSLPVIRSTAIRAPFIYNMFLSLSCFLYCKIKTNVVACYCES